MGVCGNVCCVAVVVKDRGFLSLEMLYVCVRDVMDVVFSVCIVKRGAVGTGHADVICLCRVCILWQFSVLHSARLVVFMWKRHTPEPVS